MTPDVLPRTACYGWIVTEDRTQDDEPVVESRVGWVGPHNIPDELKQRLEDGAGRVWRTVYDDVDDDGQKIVVHVGRYLSWADLDPATDGELAFRVVSSTAEFGPLWDLSAPDCGAVEVQYLEDGGWKPL